MDTPSRKHKFGKKDFRLMYWAVEVLKYDISLHNEWKPESKIDPSDIEKLSQKLKDIVDSF